MSSDRRVRRPFTGGPRSYFPLSSAWGGGEEALRPRPAGWVAPSRSAGALFRPPHPVSTSSAAVPCALAKEGSFVRLTALGPEGGWPLAGLRFLAELNRQAARKEERSP